MNFILDTNFLIEAERGSRRGTSQKTDYFFGAHVGGSFFLTFTIAGELAAGKSASSYSTWLALCGPYEILPWTLEIAWRYGVLYRDLQSKGTLIGANDLWIASTALVHQMTLVTNNAAEFQRVDGLNILPY